MAVTIKAGDSVPVLNPGTYQAVCSGVWDIGFQRQESTIYGDQIKHQIIVRFEINKQIQGGSYDGKRYTINKYFTASLHEKSTLRKTLESWRGRAFTQDELNGFDVEKLLGANCMVGVTHSQTGKAKISSVSPLMDGVSRITPELPVGEIPTWVQKAIDKQVREDDTPRENVDHEESPF